MTRPPDAEGSGYAIPAWYWREVFDARKFKEAYQEAGLLPTGPRAEGVYTAIGGVASIGSGIYALSPAGEIPSGGLSTIYGITSITAGVPAFGLGVTQAILGKPIPQSAGDIVKAGGGSDTAKAITDIGVTVASGLFSKPQNAFDYIGLLDSANTLYDSGGVLVNKYLGSPSNNSGFMPNYQPIVAPNITDMPVIGRGLK